MYADLTFLGAEHFPFYTQDIPDIHLFKQLILFFAQIIFSEIELHPSR
jgi:hypothetical protein